MKQNGKALRCSLKIYKTDGNKRSEAAKDLSLSVKNSRGVLNSNLIGKVAALRKSRLQSQDFLFTLSFKCSRFRHSKTKTACDVVTLLKRVPLQLRSTR